MSATPHLPVQRIADGDGTPLVMLPGVSCGQAVFRGVLPALGSSRPLVGVDLPGFGHSAPLPSDEWPTVEALSDAVEEALAADGLGPEAPGGPPHAIGNSLGGAVALELLRRGSLRSAVLVSPLGFQRPWEARAARHLLWAVHLLTQRLEPRADALMRTAAGRTLLMGVIAGKPWRGDPGAMAQMIRDTAQTAEMRTALDATAGWPSPRLPEESAKVLVLWGVRDAVLFPWQARRVPTALPDARVVMLPECGHVPFADDPGRIAEHVLRFLDKVEAGSSAAVGTRASGPAA